MNQYIKDVLIKNGWDAKSYSYMKSEYKTRILKAYSKYTYEMTDEILEYLALFYNIKIRCQSNNLIICFNIKKSNRYRQMALDWQAEKFGVHQVIHIADLNPGYENLWMDESGGIWGDFEQYINFYGKNLCLAVETISKKLS